MEKTILFKLNGESTQITVDEERMLLWVLRTELGLTEVWMWRGNLWRLHGFDQ
jgi:aerobic-type carbon monoxide dehydrogenase small subunit (CoxS/CutS family)